jgi:anti-anti-sigma factor
MGGVDEKAGVEITNQDGVAIVTFKATSISDAETIAIAAGQIKDFIDKNRPGKLIFDFAGVKFFSSQVLGLLLDVRSKLQIHGGRMAISAINPQLNRVFKITNLDKIFTFFPDRHSALLAMTSSG